MTDKEIDKRIEKLKKSIAADKADNSWHFIGAPPYIIGADFLDELFKRLEGVKSENAVLREKLAAAVKDIPHDCGHCLHKKSNVGHCALLPDGDEFSPDYTEGFNRDDCDFWAWRGGQEGEEG